MRCKNTIKCMISASHEWSWCKINIGGSKYTCIRAIGRAKVHARFVHIKGTNSCVKHAKMCEHYHFIHPFVGANRRKDFTLFVETQLIPLSFPLWAWTLAMFPRTQLNFSAQFAGVGQFLLRRAARETIHLRRVHCFRAAFIGKSPFPASFREAVCMYRFIHRGSANTHNLRNPGQIYRSPLRAATVLLFPQLIIIVLCVWRMFFSGSFSPGYGMPSHLCSPPRPWSDQINAINEFLVYARGLANRDAAYWIKTFSICQRPLLFYMWMLYNSGA
jgi:hypothetical protein